MAKITKTDKLVEIKSLHNVFEFPKEMKGRWNQEFFGNNNKLVLELGCGRAEYSIALAEKYPELNLIGVDIKGARLWKGAKQAIDKKLDNVALARFLIENITEYFVVDEIDEIWIPFPDPYPKPSKEMKRLVSKRFRELYRSITKPGANLYFKTDNTGLYNWAIEDLLNDESIEVIENTNDFYNSEYYDSVTHTPTYYENLFKSETNTIKYIKFKFL